MQQQLFETLGDLLSVLINIKLCDVPKEMQYNCIFQDKKKVRRAKFYNKIFIVYQLNIIKTIINILITQSAIECMVY